MIIRSIAAAILCLIAAGLSLRPAEAQTVTINSTISVTNTFQQALAGNNASQASSALNSGIRKGCLIQNTGTHTEYVYFGALASATTSNAFQVSPGQAISCATPNGLVLTDIVNITGTSGDGYVVTSQ